MHSFDSFYLLVTFLLSARFGSSIRVDWNTNKGPIIPPTPRTTQRPQPPYREPAPVWEDQSNDIPNPNPYVYVLPPPSRPRPATNNYLTADRRPVTQDNYHLYNNQHNYGSLLPPMPNAAQYYQNGNGNAQSAAAPTAVTATAAVAGLAPKYVPNVGFKYFAIVPNNNNNNNNNNYNNNYNYNKQYAALGLSNGYNVANNDKVQGKYNAKTKKYKAFEKVKYVPPNYYPFYEFALPDATPYVPIFAAAKGLESAPPPQQQQPQDQQSPPQEQQLPAINTERPFNENSLDGQHNEAHEIANEKVEDAQVSSNFVSEKSPEPQPSQQPPQFQPQQNRNQIVPQHSPKNAHTKENAGKFGKKFTSIDLPARLGKFAENHRNDQRSFNET